MKNKTTFIIGLILYALCFAAMTWMLIDAWRIKLYIFSAIALIMLIIIARFARAWIDAYRKLK